VTNAIGNGCQDAAVVGCVRIRLVLLTLVLLAAACAPDSEASPSAFHPDEWSGVVAPTDVYDPRKAGEELPEGFRQVVARDGIRPIYQPQFVLASQAPWSDDELVIGVDLAGEARAYPVGFLNRKEIVVDLHNGIPTFVTW
jgi:hypothetical protein